MMCLSSVEIARSKLYVRYTSHFSVRRGLIPAEVPGDIEGDDEESSRLEDLGNSENVVSLQDTTFFEFSYNHSIVGHLGAERTLKALSLGSWLGWHASRRHSDDFRVFDLS